MREQDLCRLFGAEVRVERADDADCDGTADELKDDKGRNRGRGNPGKGVGEDAAELDYGALADAAKSGRIPVETDLT